MDKAFEDTTHRAPVYIQHIGYVTPHNLAVKTHLSREVGGVGINQTNK